MASGNALSHQSSGGSENQRQKHLDQYVGDAVMVGALNPGQDNITAKSDEVAVILFDNDIAGTDRLVGIRAMYPANDSDLANTLDATVQALSQSIKSKCGSVSMVESRPLIIDT